MPLDGHPGGGGTNRSGEPPHRAPCVGDVRWRGAARCRSWHALAASIALAWNVGTSMAQYPVVPKWDAAVRELRRATHYSKDGVHHSLLVSLRQLRDPALKPLFQSLVQAEYWSMQVDGVFGLAELDPKGVLDPFLLAQVKSPTDRSAAIAAAIQLGMVDRDQATAILAWENLSSRDRVLLWAEIKRRGGDVDAAAVQKLSQDQDAEIAGLAGFLLASPTATDALATVTSRLASLTPKERASALVGLAAAAATFELKSAVPFFDGVLRDTALPPDARLACVAALLSLDSERGFAAWKSAIEGSTTQSQRVRLALALLTANFTLPKGASAPLRAIGGAGEAAPDPLIGRLADALDALASGDVHTAFPALIATRHRASLAAALVASKRLDTESQKATYAAFADLAAGKNDDAIAATTRDLCLEALTRLATLDPNAIGARLEQATGDESLADLLMMSLYGAGTKEASTVADAHRATASKGSASVALLLRARHAERLTTNELEELGTIAAGGSPLDASLQIQAAWLYARHAGKADQTIAAVLAPDAPNGPGANRDPTNDGTTRETRRP
ncbi:MAG: hypothetical protein U0572_14055 [Phycisphaerales bacterium]